MTTPERPESVLVTGATRGLGRATALGLAARGFRVFAGYRDAASLSGLEAVAHARRVRIEPVALEVTDPASVARGVAEVVERAGGLYAVVNNAGVTLRGYFEDVAEEEARRIVEVNLFGVMNVTRAVLPHLRRAGRGRIVVMSSVGGRIGAPALTSYVASKFAVEGFAESLSLETAPLGVQVVIVEPGIVGTEIWDKSRRTAARAADPNGPYYEWFQRGEAQADALVRSSVVTPDDVAATVARALTARRPRLRYLIGWRAGLVVSLRRHLPGELFERVYFGELLRRITGGRRAGEAAR
jgi:NAD(P)-dependent dehydrogenase (short-subunit alcohol dehydrogenase family)